MRGTAEQRRSGLTDSLYTCRPSWYAPTAGRRARAGGWGAGQRQPYQLYYLFPLTPQEQTLSLVETTLIGAGAGARGAAGRSSSRWSPAGWSCRCGRRREAASGCRRATSTSACRCAAPTTWPRWPTRSTRWPAACRTRSGNWRSFPSAAAVRLRRLARAAHPADHGPDGRRRAVRGEGRARYRPAARVRRTAAGPAGPVRGAARGPAGDQPASTPASRRWTPSRRTSATWCSGRPTARSSWPSAAGTPDRLPAAAGAVRRRGGPAPGRAGAAQPARQRGRARRGQATWWSPSRRTGTRWRSPCGTTAWGFEPGEQQLVFNRFWRADPARARTTGGTGLGLAIALEDARLHGGWLQAWGEPGGGSVFRLTLPRTLGQELAGLAAAARSRTRRRWPPETRSPAARGSPAGRRQRLRVRSGRGAGDGSGPAEGQARWQRERSSRCREPGC